MTCNVLLKEKYPRIDDPTEAIVFALGDDLDSTSAVYDFLNTWRDQAWDEIEMAYPEFLRQVGPG